MQWCDTPVAGLVLSPIRERAAVEGGCADSAALMRRANHHAGEPNGSTHQLACQLCYVLAMLCTTGAPMCLTAYSRPGLQECAPPQRSKTGAFEEDKLPKHTQAEHDGREFCQHDTARTLRGTRHGSPRHIGTGSLRAESSPSYSPHLRGSVSRLATLSVLSCHRSSPATHCVWCTLCAPQRANTHPVQHMRRSKSVHGAQDIAVVRG